MSGETLDEEEVKKELEDMQIWGLNLEGDRLVTKVEFDDFKETVFFANQVFSLAEKHFHHPTVEVEWGAVSIDLWSHEEGGITEKDLELAQEIEDVVAETDWS